MSLISSFPTPAERALVDTCLPTRAGAGFKPRHLDDWLSDPASPAFFEVHAENYMGEGGAPHAWLTRMRERLPMSLHGVGLSIGAATPPDPLHLDRLARLIERYQPVSFSEHLAWSTHDGRFFNDLLPLIYDRPTLDRVCAHIDRIQQRLGLRLLLENPSTYVEFESSDINEAEFIARVVERSGCGVLLDVANVHVSCHNHGHDPIAYLDALPLGAIGEIHLADYAEEGRIDGASLLIDHHGAAVSATVWDLYARVIDRTGPVATLIEWDNNVPAYALLRADVGRADALLEQSVAAPRMRAAS